MTEQTVSSNMTIYCFDVLLHRFYNKRIPNCPENIPNKNFPLFVSWTKGKNRNLRGCIGTFCKDLSLHNGLHEYTLISAFRDSRFGPITLDEVPHLTCSVSLLVNFEPAKNYRDWVIGVHGIHIEYKQNERRLTAVYLPEVPLEQKWDHIQTLNNLMRKGGFRGTISEKDRNAVNVERFQSEKLSLSFDEYCEFKREKGEEVLLKVI